MHCWVPLPVEAELKNASLDGSINCGVETALGAIFRFHLGYLSMVWVISFSTFTFPSSTIII